MRQGYFDGDYDTGAGPFSARYHVREADGKVYVSEVEVLEIPEDFAYPEGWENIVVGTRFDPGDTEIVIPENLVWEQGEKRMKNIPGEEYLGSFFSTVQKDFGFVCIEDDWVHCQRWERIDDTHYCHALSGYEYPRHLGKTHVDIYCEWPSVEAADLACGCLHCGGRSDEIRTGKIVAVQVNGQGKIFQYGDRRVLPSTVEVITVGGKREEPIKNIYGFQYRGGKMMTCQLCGKPIFRGGVHISWAPDDVLSWHKKCYTQLGTVEFGLQIGDRKIEEIRSIEGAEIQGLEIGR